MRSEPHRRRSYAPGVRCQPPLSSWPGAVSWSAHRPAQRCRPAPPRWHVQRGTPHRDRDSRTSSCQISRRDGLARSREVRPDLVKGARAWPTRGASDIALGWDKAGSADDHESRRSGVTTHGEGLRDMVKALAHSHRRSRAFACAEPPGHGRRRRLRRSPRRPRHRRWSGSSGARKSLSSAPAPAAARP